MKLYSDSFPNKGVIPAEFAFAIIDEKTRVKLSSNKNPHLAWSDAPEQTQSFVVLCVDATAPTDAADVNQTDREVPAELPRADFSHWVLINIPATCMKSVPVSFRTKSHRRAKPVRSSPVKRIRRFVMVLTITRIGSPVIMTWPVITTATTVPARLGTTRSCINIPLQSMRWT